MIVVPTVAGIYGLNSWLDGVTTWVHLYVNDMSPGMDTTLTDFTEASFDGYHAQLEKYWTDAISFYGMPTSWGEPLIWTAASLLDLPQTVYGYYVTDGAAGSLLWCERAPAPTVLAVTGAQVMIQPRIQWGSLS